MNEIWDKILAGVLIAWAWMQLWWARIAPIIEPIVKEAEQLALDGKIDLEDRKQLAMNAVAKLQKDGTIKLSWVQKILVSKIIDIIANRLPNFTVSQSIKEVVTNVSNENKG